MRFDRRRRHSLGLVVCSLTVLVAICGAAPVAIAQSTSGGGFAPNAAFDHAGLAARVLAKVIEPGYQRLAAASQDMTAALEGYCQGKNNKRQVVDTAFDVLVSAFGRIEMVRIGPMMREDRLDRFLFWPDRQRLGVKQINALLKKQDADVLQGTGLASRSVAVQGIGALEQVLFGDTRDDLVVAGSGPAYACSYAIAIAGNLTTIAQSVAAEWADPAGYRAQWLKPGPDNPAFLKPFETTLAIATMFSEGAERVRDQRIADPLGLNPQQSRKAAVLALSNRSLTLVSANLAGLRRLYAEGGIAEAVSASDQDQKAITDLVLRELATAQRAAQKLVGAPKPFESLDTAQSLMAVGFPLKNARQQGSQALVETAGLAIGFNSGDGD